MDTPVLRVALQAVGIKHYIMVYTEVVEVKLTKATLQKIKRVAAAVKHAGEHLVVEVRGYQDEGEWLRLWTVPNVYDVVDKEYSIRQ